MAAAGPLLAAAVAAALLLPPEAARAEDASGVRVGIVDMQRVLREAKAAREVRPRMDEIRRTFQKGVREQERQLRDAARDLADQRAVLAPELFAEKRRALAARERAAQKTVQERKQTLDRAFAKTQDLLVGKLLGVARAVAQARKLDVLLEKRTVFLSAKKLDLTSEIIARLDEALPSVALEIEDGEASESGKN